MAPLTQLHAGTSDLSTWVDERDLAFATFRRLLTSPRILRVLDLNSSTRMHTDANVFGVGAILRNGNLALASALLPTPSDFSPN